MSVSGIGIQQITPQTGTGWQGSNPSPDRNNETDSGTPKPANDRAPPSPGTGQIVDKIA
jgi:hypothetical protein